MNSAVTNLILLSISVLHVEVNCQCDSTASNNIIGTNRETAFTVERDSRFYLNTDDPAPCNGRINNWRYCFYNPAGNINDNHEYKATFAVYRADGTVGYQRVLSSLTTISWPGRDINRSRDFNCYNVNVSSFTIQAGDVVAACVYNPHGKSKKQLDIVAKDASGYSLMRTANANQCGYNSLLPWWISNSQLVPESSIILHLYATMTVPSTCIPATCPPTTTMSTTEPTTTVTWTMATTTTSETATTDVTTIGTTSMDVTTTPSDGGSSMSEVTSESGETSGTKQATHTLSSGKSTSAVTDTTTIKDDAMAQISAQNKQSGVIIGVIIAVVLLVVTGLVIAIIVAVIFKKRGKSNCGYSLSGKNVKSNGTAGIVPNGVDNYVYDVGFHNPGTLDSSINLYEDVTNSVTMSAGEGNYFELAESGFINQTHESVNDAGIYSELSAAHTSDTQADCNHQNPSGGVSYYELECYSASPEDSKELLSFLLEKNKQEDIYGNLEAYYAPASNEDEIYSQLKSCGTNNIPHVYIRIMGHLGSGQFGNVEKGMWQSKEVALKTLKTGSTEDDKVKFLQEAAIMAQFRHPNIVTLHGVVSDKEPLMLVVELMHRGDLRDHLHSIRPDPGELPMAGLSEMLLSFSKHVALGMQYLSGKGFVHRDLAARNILVSKDNICKVADFGMSRDLADETYYVSHGGMIPVKWTAPEAIHYKKYSTTSDVWSYGCLLYEIWSLGWKPFEGITNVEVIKILDSNKRLSPPPGCPRMVYELMIKCWDPIAGSRPRFRDIVIVLTGSPQDVLSIPREALDVHRLAGVLGSPLEAAKNMYSDLQNKYCSDNIYD